MRSGYGCKLCGNSEKVYFRDKLLGRSQIWIPNTSRTKVFAMPDMVIHYIDKHNYLLPTEVIEAIQEFDLNSKWTAKDAVQVYGSLKYGTTGVKYHL